MENTTQIKDFEAQDTTLIKDFWLLHSGMTCVPSRSGLRERIEILFFCAENSCKRIEMWYTATEMASEHIDRKKRCCFVKNTLDYKGYIGSVEFSEEGSLFFGKVLGIRALISYEGENTRSLVDNFHSAVDDYLTLCEERGTEPEKPSQMQ